MIIKLLALGSSAVFGAWSFGRYKQARAQGVPLDKAFKFSNWGKSIADLSGKPLQVGVTNPSPCP